MTSAAAEAITSTQDNRERRNVDDELLDEVDIAAGTPGRPAPRASALNALNASNAMIAQAAQRRLAVSTANIA